MRRYSGSRSLSGSETTMRSRESSYSLEFLSQWELLKGKFADDSSRFIDCKRFPESTKPKPCSKTFNTGSKYEGSWNEIHGMTGRGTYTFPSGVIYNGEFHEGMFHGLGEMIYPCGVIVSGRWNNGNLEETSRRLTFADGLQYNDTHWTYCQKPDRRYTQEQNKTYGQFEGLKPAFESYLTAEQPTREIPKGFYDTGSDFYKEGDSVGYKYNDNYQMSRCFSKDLARWTVKNCRKAEDNMVGPRKELYDQWWDCKLPFDSQSISSSSKRDSGVGIYEEPINNSYARPSLAMSTGWNRKNIKFDSEMDN